MSTDDFLNFPVTHLGDYLKCSDCRNYLSVPPVVVLKDTGKYKCGRCFHTGLPPHPRKPKYKGAVRDAAYEELAQHLRFPCQNQHLGCKAVEPFHQLALHESIGCTHANVPCPIIHCTEHFGASSDPVKIRRHYEYFHYYHGFGTNNSYQTCIFGLPKTADEGRPVQKYLFIGKITFVIAANLTAAGRVVDFKIRSFCTNRRYNFNIKPVNFRTIIDGGGDGSKTLFSSPGKATSSVKFRIADATSPEEYKFQLQIVGKVKEDEEFVKTPVRPGDDETLRCVKCHGFLSTKPVMLTQQGLLCGCCVRVSTAKDAVRMRAYEILAKSVLFPCDRPNCDGSFNIGDMKKHIRDEHKRA